MCMRVCPFEPPPGMSVYLYVYVYTCVYVCLRWCVVARKCPYVHAWYYVCPCNHSMRGHQASMFASGFMSKFMFTLYICVHIHTCMDTRKYSHTHTLTQSTCMYDNHQIQLYILYMYMCMSMYIYIHTHIHTYVHILTHTHTPEGRIPGPHVTPRS